MTFKQVKCTAGEDKENLTKPKWQMWDPLRFRNLVLLLSHIYHLSLLPVSGVQSWILYSSVCMTLLCKFIYISFKTTGKKQILNMHPLSTLLILCRASGKEQGNLVSALNPCVHLFCKSAVCVFCAQGPWLSLHHWAQDDGNLHRASSIDLHQTSHKYGEIHSLIDRATVCTPCPQSHGSFKGAQIGQRQDNNGPCSAQLPNFMPTGKKTSNSTSV